MKFWCLGESAVQTDLQGGLSVQDCSYKSLLRQCTVLCLQLKLSVLLQVWAEGPCYPASPRPS